jgi:hypothetical protein
MTRGVPPSVWAGRAVLFGGVLLSLFAGAPSGYGPPVPLAVLVGAAALLAAFRPEHLVLSVTLGVIVLWWTLQLHTEIPVAALVAAAGLTLAHVTATVLAYGPPTLPVDPQLALLWGARGASVWLAALVVWVVARTYAGHATPELFWLAGLGAALVGSVAVGVVFPLRGQVRE